MDIKKLLKNKPLLVGISIGLVLVLSLSVYLILGKSSENTGANLAVKSNSQTFDKFKILPVVKDSTGVSVESAFKLVCDEKADISQVKKYLTVSPQDSYKLDKVSDREFLLSFDSVLAPNSIYKFQMEDEEGQKRSWAFQTSKDFRVVRTLPRDKATAVPGNTGIEITFSHENIKDIENHFEITPKVNGRFEYHGKTVVFVPKDSLKEGAVYTVKLNKGVGLADSDKKTEEDFDFAFQIQDKTQDGEYKYFSFGDILYTFTTQITPALDVNISENLKNSEVSIDVFKYQNVDDFFENIKKAGSIPYWASYNRSREVYDTSKLSKVSSFKAKVSEYNSGYWYANNIYFPEALKEGHYLINVNCGGTQYQTHLQVNNTVLYVNVGKNKSLVWANDSIAGKPVEGALVETKDAKAVRTGKDGIAVIDGELSSPQNGYYYFKVTNGKKSPVIAPVWSMEYGYGYYMVGNNTNVTNAYWTYMYLDRGLYLPDDTVKVWGMIKPRDSKEAVSKAVAQLFRYDYTFRSVNTEGDFPVIDSREISLSPAGTFCDEMKLKDLNPGQYALRVVYKGKVMVEKGFTVKQYTKPAYKIELSPDKKAVFAWDNVKCTVAANFFEGSPVSGLPLKYSYSLNFAGYTHKEGLITCDNNGKTSLSVEPGSQFKSWQPGSININVSNAKAEEQEVNASEHVTVFPRDTMIEARGKKQGYKGIVEVRTNKIDISRIKDGNYYDINAYRGNAVDMGLKVKVYESHYEKNEIGEYYDFINKRTEKRYEYKQVKNVVQEVDLKTIDGKAILEFPYDEDKDTYRYYYAELSGTDGRGQEMLETVYVYNWFGNSFSPESIGYYFDELERKDPITYKNNEKISLAIRYANKLVPEKPKAKALYITLRNGLVSYFVSDSTVFNTTFKDELAPNFYVKAIYFDGVNVNDAGMKYIKYDKSEKELKINVQTDKTDYRPGDTVKLNVAVTGKNGSPVACEVNLSVVDEANFALENQYVDTLSSLYNIDIASGIIADYVSVKTQNNRGGGGAECGEGGDAGIRSIFKDNAFFGNIKTDEKGNGSASFKLPDNLTSWRVTYQGVSKDVRAGSGKLSIPCKLPFFVDIIFNNVFMEGDRPSVTARSFGTALKAGDEVSYNIEVEGDNGYKKSFKTSGKANSFSVTALDSLKEGSYSITIEGRAGDLRDSVKKDFKVVKSMLEITGTEYYKLSDNLRIEGGKSLTTLLFYNAEASVYYEALNSLLCSWGERVDQKMARKLSKELLKKYYDNEEIYSDEIIDIKEYQTEDGGIALLKYDSSNPVLSAKICSVSTDGFDVKALKAYFYSVLDKKESTPEDVAAAYWGLASLNEPVLIDIQRLVLSKEMDDKNKLYLGLALTELGDYDGALEVYSKLLESRGKKAELLMYIDAKDKDEIIELTSLCSMLSLKLGTADKEGLFGYVQGNAASDLLTNLEVMTYVSNSIPAVPKESSFTYELEGKENRITVKKAEIHKLVLTKDKLEKIRFKGISGDITVAASFVGPANQMAEGSNKLFSIDRSYSVNDSEKDSFEQSDFIKITIQPKFDKAAPDGYYEISDVLPAAFRYVPQSYNYEKIDRKINYPVMTDGQKVVFGFYYSKAAANDTGNMVYYARVVCPGDFTADSAAIRHSDSNNTAFSAKQKIKVN